MNMQLNLKYLAVSRIAINIWERPDIKKAMADFNYSRRNPIELQSVMHKLMREIEELMLPVPLKRYLMHAVASIGLKKFHWLRFVRKYTKNQEVRWTDCGKIDVGKIFKSVWMRDSNLTQVEIFTMACNYCKEKHVYRSWQALTDRRRSFIVYSFTIRSINYDQHLLVYWHKRINDELPTMMEHLRNHDPYNIYNLNHSIDENMFKLSLLQGHEPAVKYFWDKLNEEQKRRNLLENISLVLPDSRNAVCVHFIDNESNGYILRFIMKKLSIEERAEVYQKYKRPLLTIFINIWPWSDFLFQMLDEMRIYFTARDYDWVIVEIAKKMARDRQYGIAAENSYFQRALFQIWRDIPPDFKQFIGEKNFYACVRVLLLAGDIASISMIMLDPVMMCKRETIFECAAHATAHHTSLGIGNSYQLMHQLVASDHEKIVLDIIVQGTWLHN